MIFDGKNGGTVELTDTGLIIRRKGVLSALNQGLKGEKRVPFASITSVQFKDAGFTTGYIQFGVLGGRESGAGVRDAVKDENTVLFVKEASAEFQQLRELVEQRIGQGQSVSAAARAGGISLSEELTRLADLKDRGVLTEEEFHEQKRRLLSDPHQSTSIGAIKAASGDARPQPANTKSLPPVAAQFPKRETLDGKTMSVGRIIGYGCGGLLALFILLAVIGAALGPDTTPKTNTTETSGSEAAADLNLAASPTPADDEPASSWSYSDDEDKIRGGTTYYAATTSTNSIAQDFPYEADTKMRMTVRKSPAYGTDVILTISSGQMMCPSYEGCSGTVRFDDGPAKRISFSGPEDNNSETIFVDGAKSFIAKLKKAKRVTVEKTLYQAGSPQFEFDVSGLKWDH